MKEFLKNKTAGWYVSAVTCVIALIALITYAARGGNVYSPVSSTAVWLMVVGVVLNALVLIKDFKIGAFLPLAFFAATVAVLVNTEMLFLSNVMTGIDNNSLDFAWYVFFGGMIVSMIGSAVAFGMGLSKDNK